MKKLLFAVLVGLASLALADGYPVQVSTANQDLVFLMIDSTDHIAGKTGLTPTVTLRKQGGSFGSPAGTVSEIANGWYKIAGNTTDTGTAGPLILHATGTGADVNDTVFQVVGYNPLDGVRLGMTALPNVVSGSAGAVPTTGTGANQIAVNGSGGVTVATNGDKTGYALSGTQTFNTTGNLTGNVTGSCGSVTAAVTANTTQLAGQTVTAASGVTFPSSVASPTNITAGTITTATNLTNAPTAGDLTATMKASVTTAATAATPTIASVSGNVGGVAGVTFPSTVASPTNITAGTITNLTNAPTAGDLTAAMKTSVTTAASAATPTVSSCAALGSSAVASVTAVVAPIKTQTDQLHFTVSGQVDADTKSMNDAPVLGTGGAGNGWRGH